MGNRFSMEIINAYNGAEVISVKANAYRHSQFDNIISDWKEQDREQNRKQRESQNKSKKVLKLKRKLNKNRIRQFLSKANNLGMREFDNRDGFIMGLLFGICMIWFMIH